MELHLASLAISSSLSLALRHEQLLLSIPILSFFSLCFNHISFLISSGVWNNLKFSLKETNYFSNSDTLLHDIEYIQSVQCRHSLIQYNTIHTIQGSKDITCGLKQKTDSSFLGMVLKPVVFMK
jgi:hypothetical protein